MPGLPRGSIHVLLTALFEEALDNDGISPVARRGEGVCHRLNTLCWAWPLPRYLYSICYFISHLSHSVYFLQRHNLLNWPEVEVSSKTEGGSLSSILISEQLTMLHVLVPTLAHLPVELEGPKAPGLSFLRSKRGWKQDWDWRQPNAVVVGRSGENAYRHEEYDLTGDIRWGTGERWSSKVR